MQRVVQAAKMYYQLDYSQQQIAKDLCMSRPSVSRLIQEAKDTGIVQIKINDISQQEQELAIKIRKKYGLKECIIVNVPQNNGLIIKRYLGEKSAEYLANSIKDGDVIATTWGTTIYEVAKNLVSKQVQQVDVVQMNGGISHSETNTFAAEILNYLGSSLQTTPYFLPLPAIVERAEIRQMIMSDRHILSVLELAKEANIAIFTVGDRHEDSTLTKAGYLNETDLNKLEENQAVGDICSRFINKAGEICNEELNDRTIGLDVHNLRNKETSILIAGGSRKFNSIVGALNGAYANVLITDQFTAREL